MVSAHCVKMGDNATDVAGGVEGGKGGGGEGWGRVPHSYASLQIFTLAIKPRCSLFILF